MRQIEVFFFLNEADAEDVEDLAMGCSRHQRGREAVDVLAST